MKSKKILLSLTLALTLAISSACGSSAAPAPTVAPTQPATAAPAQTVAPAPAATTAPTVAPTPVATPVPTATPAPTKNPLAGPEPRDLGGFVFRIVDFSDNRFIASEAELGTPIGDAKMAAIESIKKDFNVDFEVVNIPPGDIVNVMQPAIVGGDLFAHMVVTTMYNYGALIGAGLLGDLSAVPTLDLSSPLWNQAVQKATTIGGKVYSTAGIFEHWEHEWIIYFQKRLWADLNLPDPYELVRSGQWTWEKLLEFSLIASQDLTGDGVVTAPEDRWGLVANRDDLLRAWYPSMGGLYFDINPATGKLYSPAATPDGIAIADWMRNFTQTPGVYYNVSGMSSALLNDMFANGRALFNARSLAVPTALMEMTDDFGILPMPKRNAQQATYLNGANHNAPMIGITTTNKDLEKTGIIMEALAARFATVRELQRNELEDIKLRSDDDVEMLDYIIPYNVYDIGHIMNRASDSGAGFRIPHSTITNYVISYSVGDFASEMEANREAMELEINEIFFPK